MDPGALPAGRDRHRLGPPRHRLLALAAVLSAAGWAADWLLAEPDSADATTLLACATVVRSRRTEAGAEERDRAREACLTAAALDPADPTPGSA